MIKNLVKKILIGLSAVGPGLFLIGYNIGTGSVTTMAKTGAEHGMKLLWVLVLSCIFTYILMVSYGKLTIVTGKTALNNINKEFRYGRILSLYILVSLIFGELLALVGIMGIVGDLVQEGIKMITGGSTVKTIWIILTCVIFMYLILWYGRYHTFEKILTIFVFLMGISFLVVFVMVMPGLSSMAAGLIPRNPGGEGSLKLIAAIAGTTCSAAVFIMRSTVIAEKGWGIGQLKTEKKDAMVSSVMMFILSGAIMAVAAGTLHVMGLKLDNTVDMIYMFEPIGGKIAAFLLILGIVGAGLSTIFPIVLIAPWLISDFRGTPRNIHSPLSRVLISIALLFAFGSVFLEQRPPALMIFSQAFQACILPAVAIPVMIMINRKKLMKGTKATMRENIGLIAVILFSLLTTYYAIIELFK